ncbi:MAG: sulfatase family protein [Cyclobacteriaceae bacterium]
MNKKQLILISLLGLFTVNVVAQQIERPNIIFILTDDQRWDAMGFAGNEIIHTPEMDRLAKEGCYFSKAFVTTPICAASRASIMTGLYERTHGFTFGTPPLAQKYLAKSYPALLKQNGYSTGFIGKFGMSFQDKADTSLFDFYQRPGEQGGATTYYRLTPDGERHRHLSTIIGDYSLEFLEQKQNEKSPFCLSISFHAPHAEDGDPRQYIYPQDLDSLYDDIEMPWPIMATDADFMAQPQYVREGLNRIRWYWRFDSPEKYQEKLKGYYRMISGVDRELGRIRSKLNELDLAENTIIILMGDNGYFLGERQFAGKWLMYDNSLRVPLIVYDPKSKSSTTDFMALNIDIAPTLLDYAGVTLPESIAGQSVKKLVQGKGQLDRDYFMGEHLFNHPKIPKSEGIRTKRFKYFRYIDHPEREEFYDLEKDPTEAENLIDDPNHQVEIARLKELLDEELKH